MGLAELTRNAVDVLPNGELDRKLALARPLRVKLGIDVTSPDIHVGRAIPLQRMRAFQDEGHLGVLIIGDYTTRIGDPSGRSAERPVLTDEEIERNARTYTEQAMIVLDPARTEVRYNGEWLSKLSYAEVVQLARTITVARILERDDFAKRYAAREPISVSELLYPLMQAYDSVAIEADVELGGTDLQRMRASRRGHLGVLIVGDYTTRIGDSGRSAERPMIARCDRRERAAVLRSRRRSIIDPGRTELRFNSEWLAKLDVRGDPAADAHDDGRAAAGARRLRKAVCGEGADLGLGAALPADAGLRLGRRRGRRRARRNDSSTTCSPAAT